MSVSRATKLNWFHKAAAALDQQFPGAIERQLGRGVGPVYVCPICEPPRVFLPASIDTGELTAEHVPPKSFGGRELVLTCKRCNNDAGARLDAHARRKEKPIELLSGAAPGPLWVQLTHEGQQVNAQLSKEDETYVFRVISEHNNPKSIEAFRKTGPPKKGKPLGFSFHRDRFSELGAKLSWFRSGYLALFAVAGYRFVFNPATRIVRKQLADWTQRHIECFTVTTPHSVPSGTKRILHITAPTSLQCDAVQFGRYLVLFPGPGDMNFYDRLSSDVARADGQQQHFDCSAMEWPTAPSFGLQEPLTPNLTP